MSNPSHKFDGINRQLDAFEALPDRVKLPAATLLSIVIHLVLIVGGGLILKLIPPSDPAAQLPAQEKKALEITLAAPTPAPLTKAEEEKLQELFKQLPVEDQLHYIDVDGLAAKKNLSKRVLLESWRDSVAGTKKQGNGDLPSQEGLTDLPFTKFKTQELIAGNPENTAMADVAERAPKSAERNFTEAPPIFKPQPVTKEDLNNKKKDAPIPKTAVPAPETLNPELIVLRTDIPKELPKVTTVKDDEIAVFISAPPEPDPVALIAQVPPTPPAPKPTPVPTPAPATPTPVPNTPVPMPRLSPTPAPDTVRPTPSPMQVAKFTTPQPAKPTPAPSPGMSVQTRQRKTDGSDAPVGENGVDAIETARGRYNKTMEFLVVSRWQLAVKDKVSVVTPGMVTVRYTLNAEGKMVRFHVEDNTSNNAHALIVEECMRATKFLPPPPEMLRNGVFEDRFTFNLYTPPQ